MLTFPFGHVHETKLTPKRERGNSLNLLKNFPPNREEKPHWNRISSKELGRKWR